MPDHLFPPKLIPMAEDYIEAFWSLNTDRPAGMTVGMIPFSSIDRYAARYGYNNVDDFSIFEDLIRRMDRLYLQRRKKDG